MNKISPFIILGIVALGAFFYGKGIGRSEYQDYIMYSDIQRAWRVSSIIDLIQEKDVSLIRERLMYAAGLDATHEAGIAIYPERFRESLDEDFAIYREDFANIEDIREYAFSLLETRRKKLEKHDWFKGSKFEDRLLKNIEELKTLIALHGN